MKHNRPLRKLVKETLASLNDHWVGKSIVVLIPAIATFLLAFPPIQNYFLNDDGRFLNIAGIIVALLGVGCLGIEVLSNLVSSYDTRDITSYIAENQVRKSISVNEATYEEDKNRTLRAGFRQIAFENNELNEFILHYVNPRERTNQILSQIGKCLADECDVEANEIVLSAVIKFNDDEWKWFCHPEFEGRAHLKELLTKNSALKEVIESKTYFFCNDKQAAIDKQKYFPDRRDRTHDNIGSIICWEVGTDIDHAPTEESYPIRMIISISTYGKYLIDPEDKPGQIDRTYIEVIERMILDQFKGELTENLVWYGLMRLKK